MISWIYSAVNHTLPGISITPFCIPLDDQDGRKHPPNCWEYDICPPLWQPSWRVLLFFSASWRFADLDRRCSLARKHLKPSQKFTIEFNKPEICLGYFVDWVVLRLPKPPKSDGGDELKAGLLRRWSLVQVSTDPASHNVPSDRFLFEIVVATKQKASYTNDVAIFYCQQLSYSSIRSFSRFSDLPKSSASFSCRWRFIPSLHLAKARCLRLRWPWHL